MGDRLVWPHDLNPVAHDDALEEQLDQLQFIAKIVQQLATQVETLSLAAAPIQ
jgi:hypothetical protein